MSIGDGENVQFVTGDEAVDTLEKRIASGEDVKGDDILNSFLDEESIKEAKRFMENKKLMSITEDEGFISVDDVNEDTKPSFFDNK